MEAGKKLPISVIQYSEGVRALRKTREGVDRYQYPKDKSMKFKIIDVSMEP